MYKPMKVDHVSGSEPEDWQDVDDVRSGDRHISYGMGHIATDCGRKGKGEVKSGDGSKGYAKGEDKTTLEDLREYRIGHKSAECRRGVAGVQKEHAACRRSGGQRGSEEDGEGRADKFGR